jgi:hypothetical protein
MSGACFHKWRVKYGGVDVSLIARNKELEDEKSTAQKNVYQGVVKV